MFSLFLCLVLCLGLVPVSVLAAEEPRDEGIEIVNTSEPIALFEEGSSVVTDEEPVDLEDESVDPSESPVSLSDPPVIPSDPPVILSDSEGSPEEAPVDLIGETDAVDLSAVDVNAETGTYNGMNYSVSNGEATITGYTADLPAVLVIPETIEEYPVKKINRYAFSGCTGLTSVDLPDSVAEIGDGAFQYCSNLESINYPMSLTKTGSDIFRECPKLTSITVPEGVTVLPGSVFKNAAYLKQVSLPSTLTEIGANAFDGCGGLTGIDLPDGLTKIGRYVFSGCTGLTSVDLPDSVAEIGDGAFQYCSNLESINYPMSLTRTGPDTFRECPKLTSITVPEGVIALPANVFKNAASLQQVILPSTLTEIGSRAFDCCSGLTSIALPAAVSKIGQYAFAACPSLAEVFIPGISCSFAGDTVFASSPLTVIYCKACSDALTYAVANSIPFQLLETEEGDFDGFALNIDESGFYTTSQSGTVNGMIPMTVKYSISDEMFSNLSNRKITVRFADSFELVERSVSLNGSATTDYTYSFNTLTINADESSGTLQFYATPMEAGVLAAFAQFTYRQNSANKAETIGVLYLNVPLLKLNAPSQTSLTSFDVTGVTSPGETVIFTISGEQAGTAKAKKDGTFSGKVSFPGEPVSGRAYTLAARLQNDPSVESNATIYYRESAPVITQFDMYYYAHSLQKLDLLNADGTRFTNPIQPGKPFKFVVRFDNYSKLGKVCIASTKNGVTSLMQAESTENPGEYIAEGYFEGTRKDYIPGNLNVYYTTVVTEEDLTRPFTMEELPEYWQNCRQTVIVDTENQHIKELLFEDGESATIEAVTLTESEFRARFMDGDSSGTTAYKKPDAETQDVASTFFEEVCESFFETYIETCWSNDVDMLVAQDDEKGETIYVKHDSLKETVETVILTYSTARVLDALTGAGAGNCMGVAGVVVSEAALIIEFQDVCIDLESARAQIMMNSSMTPEERSAALADLVFLSRCYTSLYALKAIVPIVGLYITMANPLAGFLFTIIANTILDLAEKGVLDKWLAYLKAGGQGILLRWLIDPSGYVYDAESEERLEGVTVTAYWIEKTEEDDDAFWDSPPEDSSYGTLWDASEYSQMNPLSTDEEGCYAWDMPEGWWRVKFEMPGYETAWSQWMSVPPIQTEVNVGLMPVPAGPTVTVTGVSLTLKGQIGIYVYAQVPEEAVTARLTYPKTGEVKTFALDKNPNYYVAKTDQYKFLYENVPAKEMTQPLELEVFDAKGNALPIVHSKLGPQGTKFTCQAVDYCKTIIENPDQPDKLKDLVKAILNYGQCAQIQFGYDLDHLANPEGYLAEEMKTVEADPANDPVIPSNATDVGWEYGTLTLKGAVSANLYFSKQITAKDASGKTYTVKAKSGKWCITFDNIPAKNLGDKYTVVASYGSKTATIQYSALSYINAVLAQKDTDSNANLKELCRAMILYNKYAKAYFGK